MLILFVCDIHVQWSQSLICEVLSFSFHTACGNGFLQVLFILHKEAYFSDIFRGWQPCLVAGDQWSSSPSQRWGGSLNLPCSKGTEVIERAKTHSFWKTTSHYHIANKQLVNPPTWNTKWPPPFWMSFFQLLHAHLSFTTQSLKSRLGEKLIIWNCNKKERAFVFWQPTIQNGVESRAFETGSGELSHLLAFGRGQTKDLSMGRGGYMDVLSVPP